MNDSDKQSSESSSGGNKNNLNDQDNEPSEISINEIEVRSSTLNNNFCIEIVFSHTSVQRTHDSMCAFCCTHFIPYLFICGSYYICNYLQLYTSTQ